MKGHPATGKSILAQTLAMHLRWPLIDKDDVKDYVVTVPGGNQLAYAIMWQVVERQLQVGLNVIADSPLSYPIGYATGCALAQKYGAKLLVVETNLDREEWRRRLEARSAAESSHKIRGWQAMQAQLAAYADCWRYPIQPEHHLIVDTSRGVQPLVDQVCERLNIDSKLDN